MAIPFYLAMTPHQFQNTPRLPRPAAWMGCRFSGGHPGLSDLPEALPPGSLLMLNDSRPMDGHDHGLILEQLSHTAEAFLCDGIVLDFQRPWNGQTAALVRFLSSRLPSPMAVSEIYAKDTDQTIFLSPTPPDVSLAGHLAPWKGRDIWLDLAPAHRTVILTESGAQYGPWDEDGHSQGYFRDNLLHTHYRIETGDCLRFPMFRTTDDLLAMLAEAEGHRVTKAVGLYQEWEKSPGFP